MEDAEKGGELYLLVAVLLDPASCQATSVDEMNAVNSVCQLSAFSRLTITP